MKILRMAHSCLKGFMLLILVLAGCSSPEPGPVTQSMMTGRHDTLQKAAVNQARSKALRSPKNAEDRARYAYALSVHGLHKDAAYEFSMARLLDRSGITAPQDPTTNRLSTRPTIFQVWKRSPASFRPTSLPNIFWPPRISTWDRWTKPGT